MTLQSLNDKRASVTVPSFFFFLKKSTCQSTFFSREYRYKFNSAKEIAVAAANMLQPDFHFHSSLLYLHNFLSTSLDSKIEEYCLVSNAEVLIELIKLKPFSNSLPCLHYTLKKNQMHQYQIAILTKLKSDLFD